MAEQIQTISAEKLCALTSLTDRRHRQIAKLGYFPSPIKSQYQLTATLQGLFKYYREQNEYRKNKKEKIDDEKHRKLKLENDEAEGLLANKQELAGEVSASLVSFRDEVYAVLRAEAPTAMAGVGVPEARIVGGRLAEKLLLKLQEIFRKWKT